MSRYVFKLPDLGEGTVQAEIVAWRVKAGDSVHEDDVICEVMTDKAAVEVPSPVTGKVLSTTGSPGDSVPVGSELIVFETEEQTAAKNIEKKVERQEERNVERKEEREEEARKPNGSAGRVATSPAIRRMAHDAGVDLTQLHGSGPNGRIVREDFESFVAGKGKSGAADASQVHARAPSSSGTGLTEEIKIIGVRRLIAQKMSDSKRNIPHFAYVEELDVTELESLRLHVNGRLPPGAAPLTYLPFLVVGLIRVLAEFPQCNATYEAERGVLVRYKSVHVGVATQTPEGLKVPVVRDAQLLTLWELAAQMRRVSEAARANTAKREELTGSTITVTSLGKLGGIASTPIINAPEVAIVGVNRAVERPVVVNGAIAVRRMMNLSSSFDHRFVDGYDAAAMVQALKERIEHPATLFMA
ncbi:MAG TPA: dihydrolipoamide acetyltransferase family protein [Steroidobacteraceae bacterium]|jgi:2-oxoisovalerate dehydrogenase E2 component (dihydrolipoyl transacylase)